MSLPGGGTARGVDLGDLFGIPVALSPWWFLMAVFVVANYGDVRGGLGVVLALTLSVLVHELGHALVARHYDLKPSVMLHAMGGWCAHRPTPDLDHQIRITIAGPAAGLALGIVSGVVWLQLPAGTPPGLSLLAFYLAFTNVFWSGVNLLPVSPLDGGRLLEALLAKRLTAEAAHRWTHRVGLAMALVAMGAGIALSDGFLAILFGFLAWMNYQQLSAR